MKYLLIILIFPFLSAGECGHKKDKAGDNAQPVADVMKETKPARDATTTDSLPPCLRKVINDGSKQSPQDLPIQIDEYVYNGKTVYLFNAPCCDQYNMLYDDSCKAICAPSGGFTGQGDRKCLDFTKEAKHIRVVWRNPMK